MRFLTNLNAVDCYQTTTNEQLIYFSTNSYKSSGQFENSVFEIRTKYTEKYTPYCNMSFYMKRHFWMGGKATLGFGADWIKTLVSMTTKSFTTWENVVETIAPSFVIGSSYNL